MHLITRAAAIIARPREEWPRIAQEEPNIAAIYLAYVLPLAAIPAVASALGASLVGIELPGMGVIRMEPGQAFVSGAFQYAMQLATVYVMALVLAWLAPRFGGSGERAAAFKVVAYAFTPTWLAGVFNLFPALSFLTLLGLYAVYLIYTGLPAVMNIPQRRALMATALLILIGIVLSALIGALIGMIGLARV
ncbi:MAG: YIP1 family protein [Salinarimonas sp.]|nr:YIP1 family protein [Salinarimonas sp.]